MRHSFWSTFNFIFFIRNKEIKSRQLKKLINYEDFEYVLS